MGAGQLLATEGVSMMTRPAKLTTKSLALVASVKALDVLHTLIRPKRLAPVFVLP